MTKTPGGWKSINYSLKVANNVGYRNFIDSITSKNTCKVCAYGMGGQRGGMINEAGEKLEVCKKSIQAQLTDIQPEISPDYFTRHSIKDLQKLRPRELERLGRLNHPLYKAADSDRFTTMSWEDALNKIINRFKSTPAGGTFFYASGRSSNEAAFILHLFARLYGTNNVNNCSYYCHQASGAGMQASLGTGTATIQLDDLKHSDLIFVFGANPASNHPRFLTELMHCRKRNGKVIVVNPAKEPGLLRFAIPSSVGSMVSGGSSIASHFLQPHIGGDIALIKGIAKYVLTRRAEDNTFIKNHTIGFEAFAADIEQTSWDDIEKASGVTREEIEQVGEGYCNAEHVVMTWAMGLTHHRHGVENVESIVNLALLRGMMGKKNAGLLPLRGHSNVQGVGSMGVSPKLKEQIFDRIQESLKINLPTTPGWDTMSCIHAAHKGEVDLAFLLGGNLFGSTPNRKYTEEAFNRIPFKIFLSTTLNEGHVFGTKGETIILPVMARDEEIQPTTQESMFNFIRLSDGGLHRLSNVRSEVDIITDIAMGVLEEKKFSFAPFKEHQHIRKAIARCVPGFEKIEALEETREEFSIGGRTLHQPEFNTPDKKAVFKVINIPEPRAHEKNQFRLMSVRSEGQFNTIVYEEEDVWRNQTERWVVLLNPLDIQQLGLTENDNVNIESDTGRMTGVRVRKFDIRQGNVMGYYPETNVLIATDTDPRSLTPSFKNTVVRIERAVP